MKDKLTKQDKKFVEVIAETGNQTLAAKKAYGIKHDDYAGKKGSLKVREGKIQKAIKSIADSIPDELLVNTHLELLKSNRMDHMVFPLGPKEDRDINLSGEETDKDESDNDTDDGGENPIEMFIKEERTSLTDNEIKIMLGELGCQVRRIVHGNTARHVYFWSPDNMARDKALDKGYKIKGTYANVKVDLQFVPREDLKEYD